MSLLNDCNATIHQPHCLSCDVNWQPACWLPGSLLHNRLVPVSRMVLWLFGWRYAGWFEGHPVPLSFKPSCSIYKQWKEIFLLRWKTALECFIVWTSGMELTYALVISAFPPTSFVETCWQAFIESFWFCLDTFWLFRTDSLNPLLQRFQVDPIPVHTIVHSQYNKYFG